MQEVPDNTLIDLSRNFVRENVLGVHHGPPKLGLTQQLVGRQLDRGPVHVDYPFIVEGSVQTVDCYAEGVVITIGEGGHHVGGIVASLPDGGEDLPKDPPTKRFCFRFIGSNYESVES